MSNTQTTKWWQGTNFYIALIMVVGGLWTGVQESDVKTLVSGVFGVIASAGLLREKLKGSEHIPVKDWIKSKNTWNYIAIAVIQVIPAIPAELFARLNEIASAAIDKNWTAFISAVLSAATIIYFWVRGNQTAKANPLSPAT